MLRTPLSTRSPVIVQRSGLCAVIAVEENSMRGNARTSRKSPARRCWSRVSSSVSTLAGSMAACTRVPARSAPISIAPEKLRRRPCTLVMPRWNADAAMREWTGSISQRPGAGRLSAPERVRTTRPRSPGPDSGRAAGVCPTAEVITVAGPAGRPSTSNVPSPRTDVPPTWVPDASITVTTANGTGQPSLVTARPRIRPSARDAPEAVSAVRSPALTAARRRTGWWSAASR